ncbi:MAG: DUF2195 family protein [Pseudomonadota bacterium]
MKKLLKYPIIRHLPYQPTASYESQHKDVNVIKALTCNLIGLLSFNACLKVQASNEVDIDNTLSACITITHSQVVSEAEMPVMHMDYHRPDPTAACGCMSKVSSFNSYIVRDSFESHVLGGNFVFEDAGSLTLPIAAQRKLISRGDMIKITISCAGPD